MLNHTNSSQNKTDTAVGTRHLLCEPMTWVIGCLALVYLNALIVIDRQLSSSDAPPQVQSWLSKRLPVHLPADVEQINWTLEQHDMTAMGSYRLLNGSFRPVATWHFHQAGGTRLGLGHFDLHGDGGIWIWNGQGEIESFLTVEEGRLRQSQPKREGTFVRFDNRGAIIEHGSVNDHKKEGTWTTHKHTGETVLTEFKAGEALTQTVLEPRFVGNWNPPVLHRQHLYSDGNLRTVVDRRLQ